MHIVERLENFVYQETSSVKVHYGGKVNMIILNMRSEYECWFYVQILWVVAGVWRFISSLDDGLSLLRSQISSQKKPKDKSK